MQVGLLAGNLQRRTRADAGTAEAVGFLDGRNAHPIFTGEPEESVAFDHLVIAVFGSHLDRLGFRLGLVGGFWLGLGPGGCFRLGHQRRG